MGLIQNKLRQNSFQSMSFLFFSIFTWHDIIDINMFPIYLSITTRGDPWAGLKIIRNKIPSKVCPFFLYYLHLACYD